MILCHPQGTERGWRLSELIYVAWSSKSCLCDETPIWPLDTKAWKSFCSGYTVLRAHCYVLMCCHTTHPGKGHQNFASGTPWISCYHPLFWTILMWSLCLKIKLKSWVWHFLASMCHSRKLLSKKEQWEDSYLCSVGWNWGWTRGPQACGWCLK
jgi:hypothetical protein